MTIKIGLITGNTKAALVVNAVAQKIPNYFVKPQTKIKQGYTIL
jgi:hypothetical protein